MKPVKPLKPLKRFKAYLKEETVQVYTILVQPEVSEQTLQDTFYEMYGFTAKHLESGSEVLITARPIQNAE